MCNFCGIAIKVTPYSFLKSEKYKFKSQEYAMDKTKCHG